MTMHFSSRRHRQSGAMLLEALIAILMFSLGVLGIVGLQAVSIKLAGDAKYRSDAALLAEEMLGQMWASDRVPANMSAIFGTGADACSAQLAGVAAAAAACTACGVDFTSVACQSYPTYTTWLGYGADIRAVRTVRNVLPQVAATLPTVVVDTTANTATTGTVTITVRWQAPNEATAHTHVVTAQIR